MSMLQAHQQIQIAFQNLQEYPDTFQPIAETQSWSQLIETRYVNHCSGSLETWTIPEGTRLYKGVTVGETPNATRGLYLGDLSVCSRYAFDGTWRDCLDGQIIVYQTMKDLTLINMDQRQNFPILQQIAPGQIQRQHNRLSIYEGMDIYLYAYGYHPDRPDLFRHSDREIDYVLMELLGQGFRFREPIIHGIASRNFPEICLFPHHLDHTVQLLSETYTAVLADYPKVTIVQRQGSRVVNTYLCDINQGFC